MPRFLRQYEILLPLLILVVFAGPVVAYMLPAYESHLSEVYQPLRALKFLSSFGQEYHKWGVMPNFLLAPGYAITLGYWYLTGAFSNPSDTFPHGLSAPLAQLTFLIVQGRVLFFILALISLIALIRSLRALASNQNAICLGVIFALATNIIVIRLWPCMKPDGLMLTFCALALAVYIHIIHDGFTTKRGVWLSFFAVFAISCKELAAAFFILPYLGILWMGWRESLTSDDRARFRRSYAISIVTGVASYALINIIYAPATWWRRVQFWLGGPGKDPDIWGGQEGGAYFMRILASIANNLGPGGCMVLTIAVLIAIRRPTKELVLLTLPLLSVFLIGLLPMGYAHDRFYLPFVLALIPVAVIGLARLDESICEKRGARIAWWSIIAIALLANLNFATFTHHQLQGLDQAAIDRYAINHISPEETVNILSLWPVPAGKERLNIFRLTQDGRSLIELQQSDPEDLPKWILTPAGRIGFLNDAARYPGRAKMLADETGFDIERWRGVEALGYELVEEVEPTAPAWFLFDWMPAPREHHRLHRLMVYRRE